MSTTSSIINGREVIRETLVLTDSTTKVFSSIDWLKPRAPFGIILNDGAENLAAAASVDLEGSSDGGTTWYDLDDAFVADIDGVRVFKPVIPDTVGIVTEYRVSVDSTGDDSLNSIDVVVISDPADRVYKPKA